MVPPIQKSQGQSVQTRHSEVPVLLYLKCVVAGLVSLILAFGVIFVFVAGLLLVSVMAGFVSGFGFEKPHFRSPVFWLVSLAVFGAGFLWELRRLAK